MEAMAGAVPHTLLQETFEPEAGGVSGCVLLCATLPWMKPFWRKCYLWGKPGGDSIRCLPPQAAAVFPFPD